MRSGSSRDLRAPRNLHIEEYSSPIAKFPRFEAENCVGFKAPKRPNTTATRHDHHRKSRDSDDLTIGCTGFTRLS